MFEEAVQADIAALEEELAELKAAPQAAEAPKQIPKRQTLPPELPRISISHEPSATVCTTPGCVCQLKRIGEDVSEKLDYTVGVFTVHGRVYAKTEFKREIEWDSCLR